jgi:acetyl-CoA carboxylase carboxyl transferase subunit beta
MTARERIRLLLDPGSFQETSAELVSIDPLLFHDRLPVADRLAEAREQPSVADAAVTGVGTIGGQPAVIIALDLAAFGTGIGIVAGEKIALAIEYAVTRRLPVIAICSGGGGKAQEGVLSLAQISKLASSAARLRRVGLPLIALLTHPTTGNVLVGIANQADIAFAEPVAQVGLDPSRTARAEGVHSTAETLIQHGAIDGVLDRSRQRGLLERLLKLLANRGSSHAGPAIPPGSTVLRAHEELTFARRSIRPAAPDYIERLASDFIELRGDRFTSNSPAIAGGIARVEGATTVVIGVTRDGAGLTDQAFAKVNRLLRLAAHLELPVVTLVEAGGSATQDGSETGLGMALTLSLLTAMPVPVVSVVIGEVRGLSGMTLLAADRIVMQEHAVISVGAGDPVASARDCLRLGLVDVIAPEPEPAADADPDAAALALGTAIANALAEVAAAGSRRLADDRTRRLRHLGLTTPEAREFAKIEWKEFQEVQRRIGRSIEDLRQRWEHRQLQFPPLANRPGLPQWGTRPSLPSIVLPKFTIRRPDLTEFANRVQTTRRGLALRDHRESEQTGESLDERE